jgi:hypothetical protein
VPACMQSESFQPDIFPDTYAAEPSISAEQYFGACRQRISLSICKSPSPSIYLSLSLFISIYLSLISIYLSSLSLSLARARSLCVPKCSRRFAWQLARTVRCERCRWTPRRTAVVLVLQVRRRTSSCAFGSVMRSRVARAVLWCVYLCVMHVLTARAANV